jgi:hypothetical protein
MKISSGNINPIQISSTTYGNGGKVTFPVNRNDSPYAHYKYVRGIPAVNSQHSVPLKKLELINNMIISLQNLNKIVAEQRDLLRDNNESVQLNNIENIGQEIHDKLQALPPSFVAAKNTAAATGMAFDLNV